jgi:hypothetical protein
VEVGREHHFDTVVTCTPTAREILQHVQPLLEADVGHELVVSDRGHFSMSSGEVENHAFQSRNVLIFTDVMASGSLVREMAARVVHSGGEVVALLCVVLTDTELAAGLDPEEGV